MPSCFCQEPGREPVKKRTVRAMLVLALLGAAAGVLGLTASRGHETGAQRAGGVVREGSSAEQARERAAASSTASTATLGPHVGTGEFQGVSTAVADLPVVQA